MRPWEGTKSTKGHRKRKMTKSKPRGVTLKKGPEQKVEKSQ